MPSYIELDQNTTFPSASAVGKLVFGVNPSNQVVLVDSNGVTSSFASTPTSVPTASYAFLAMTSSRSIVTNTTTGPLFYPTFVADVASTDKFIRTNSGSFAYNADTNTLTVTASVATSASVATRANNSYVIVQFSHGSQNPGDNITYFIGNVPDLGPGTTDVAGRRLTSPVNGVIDYVTIVSNVGGTLGTTESSSFTVNNITNGTSTTFATDFQHNASSRISTYTGFTPLPVTASNEIQIRWTGPSWATNPTTVRQNFIVRITVS